MRKLLVVSLIMVLAVSSALIAISEEKVHSYEGALALNAPKNSLRPAVIDTAAGAVRPSAQTINVAALPLSASFSVSANPTIGSPVTFTATVSGGTAPYSFSWNFGDGSAAGTGNPVTHTYTSSGDKTVTLTVTDASGGFGFPSDTWEFSGGVWTLLSPSTSPSLGEVSMVYDTADAYVLLFSGGNTWEFHGGQWTLLSPSASPSALVDFSMVYDAADGYVLLFGGISNSPGYLGDTWQFHGGQWTQLSPSSSPPARFSASMAYDAADGYVLLFGGGGNIVGILGDTWEFHGGQWTQLSPASSPSPRQYASMEYDAVDGHVLLFGGVGGTGPLSDTWEFHGGQWTQLSPSSSPPARWLASMAYDAADGYLLLFGGFDGTSAVGGTWEFHGGQWTQLATSTAPSPRFGAFMAYDVADGYVLFFGGLTVSAPNQSTTSQTISIATSSDFTISASPASVTIPPDTGISTITIAPTIGSTGTVDLTSTILPAAGLTCTLSPTSITGGSGTSMLSCSGLAGSYTVTVTGTSGLLSHSVDVVFTIAPAADFTIFASPASVTVKVGDTGTSTIGMNGFNGFTATVDLSHVEFPTTGLTCSLSPTSVTGGSGSSTLSCSGVAGIYTVTVSGVSGTASHSVDVSFIVTSAPDFKISASPASVNIVARDTGTSTITINPVNGFTGTVDLTHSESPVGLSCSLSPTSIIGGSGISTLSCAGSAGIYAVTVSGISGQLTHSVDVTFVVTPPLDFAISASPTSVTIVEGETGTSTITVDSVNGFTGTVLLTPTILPSLGLTCTLSPTEIILGTSGTSNLSCSGAAGTYTVAVVGTSGSLSHSVDVAFTVNLPFDFEISSSPARVTVAEGSTGTSTITITPLNGFTGIVELTHSLSVGTGLTCTLDPTSIAGGSGSSTLSCSGSAGIYAVTVTGTSGALSHSLDVIFDVTALPHPTSTTLSCIPSTVVINQATTCTATVTDTATGPTAPKGMVTLSPGGMCALAGTGGSATCFLTITPSAAGTLSVSASYGGDTTHQASSGSTTVTVNLRTTTTSVACTPSIIVINQATSCTATVADVALGTASTPAGTVTFTLGGSCVLVSGSCSVSITPTTAGSLLVSAGYGGDPTHAPSSGSATVTVNPRTTSTTIVCIPSTVVIGQASSCTATVTDTSPGAGTTPTGTVTWTHTDMGTFSSATCPLVGGSCSVNYTPSAAGSHVITGSYGDDTTHAVSGGTTIVTVQSQPDFGIAANLPTLILPQGYGNSTRIVLTSLGNFQGIVRITPTSTSPFLYCNTSSVSLQPGGTADFSQCLYAPRSVPVGSYAFNIIGTSGSLVHSISISVVVVSSATLPGLSISASPSIIIIQQGQSGSTSLTVSSINGYSGSVNLFVNTPYPSTYSIAPSTFVLSANGIVNVNFAISSSTLPVGRYFYGIAAFSPTFSPTTTDGKFDFIYVIVDVTVPTPAQASQNLISAVNNLPLSGSAKTSVLGPLNNIVKILTDKDPTNDISACDKLSSFINIVNNDQRKGILTIEQAAQLRQLATSIMSQLGC